MLNALDNLPEDPVELRRVTELLASEVKAQALMIEKLQHQLHGANRHRFGSKSEGMDQLQLFAENEEIAEAAVKAAETAPAEPIELKEKPGRKPLPDHLERIEQVLSVGEDCPECGGDLSKPGEDITEELEYIPGRFVVNKITRPRMACRRCEAISQAPMPSRPIERGRPGPGLLAHVLVSRFADHLPLYRQSQIYAREGVDLDRSTMADWVGKSVPIRLSPTPTTSRVLPVARVKLGVSGSGDIASDSEQGPEGVERAEPPVEAEGELVEVGLEVLVAHAVMNATQPRLQVGEDEMNDRQILLSDLGVASLGDGEVFVAALGEAGIAGPIVGDDRRTRSNGALDKAAERFRAAVWHDSESDTSGVATALPLIELGSRLALSHFNGAGDKKLVVNAPALAARAAADPGFVDFDMVAGLAADAVLIRPNHTSAELVEDLKGGFVTGKPDLALELCGRHAGRLAGNQIGRPEPYAQRRMGALHDRPRRQPGVAAALSTAQDAGPAGEAERLCRRLAMGADEPVTPPRLLQVGGTGRVIREKSLKLGKRPRKRKVFALRNIHPRFVRLPSHSTPHPTYSGCG